MANFDFVTGSEFRDSLTRDAKELEAAFAAEAWKSVLILAGSIVEALLVDYLVVTPSPARASVDPLKITLAEAVKHCRAEGAITERTADLCSVIRSYRNLVHPGRAVRLEEPPPDASTARIAMSLVDLIAEDVMGARRASIGLTAEQVLSKLERDPNSLTILRHLLSEVHEDQLRRLVTDLLPARLLQIGDDIFPADAGRSARLSRAYRVCVDNAPVAVKQAAAGRFVEVLRDGDGDAVDRYSGHLFTVADIAHVAESSRALVCQHFLAGAPKAHTRKSAAVIAGILAHLRSEGEVNDWLDPFLRALVDVGLTEPVRRELTYQVSDEASFSSGPVEKFVEARLQEWLVHFDLHEEPAQFAALKAVAAAVQDARLPF